MDINFSHSADYILLEVLGSYLDAQGMMWSDGVSQKQYDDWCVANKSPSHDIRSVSWTPTKKQIVSELYWIPNGRLSPPGLDYLLLDIGWFFVNPVRAVIVMQMYLGVPTSGIIDDTTKAMLGKLKLPLGEDFVNNFCDEYEIHVTDVIASHPADEDRLRRFWPNRVAKARENAIAIIRMGLK